MAARGFFTEAFVLKLFIFLCIVHVDRALFVPEADPSGFSKQTTRSQQNRSKRGSCSLSGKE